MTCIGGGAGNDPAVETMVNCVFLGTDARPGNFGNTQQNQIVIGSGAISGGDHTVTIGTATSTGSHRVQVAWTVGISDVRGKEEIEPANRDTCIETVKAMPVKRWKWRDFLNRPNQHEVGWIADDVERIFPKSVSVVDEQFADRVIEDCKHHNVHHEALPTLWAAVQRLIERIEELERERDERH